VTKQAQLSDQIYRRKGARLLVHFHRVSAFGEDRKLAQSYRGQRCFTVFTVLAVQ
jgi:hypothetical protein